MKYCTCPHCDTYFKLAGASKDSLGCLKEPSLDSALA